MSPQCQGYCVWRRPHLYPLVPHWMASDALELLHNLIGTYAGTKRQGSQPADGLQVCGIASACFTQGREHFEGLILCIEIYGDEHVAMARAEPLCYAVHLHRPRPGHRLYARDY